MLSVQLFCWYFTQFSLSPCHIVCFLYSLSRVQSDEPLGWSQAKDRCCEANKSHTFVDLESHPNAVVCSKCVLDPIYHSVLSWSLATYRLSLRNLTCRSHDVPRNQCKIGQVVPPYLLAPCKIVFFFASGGKNVLRIWAWVESWWASFWFWCPPCRSLGAYSGQRLWIAPAPIEESLQPQACWVSQQSLDICCRRLQPVSPLFDDMGMGQ